jgi:two-component system chemotaxis response regulator CheY
MRTLVVEDDFLSRMILQKMLQPFGSCDVVVNGKEAIQAFKLAILDNNPYTLICLDIMMPEMDGKEALKLIRQEEQNLGVIPKNEVRIMMVTALDAPKDVIDAYFEGGCTSYLVKPINKIKIMNALKELQLYDL